MESSYLVISTPSHNLLARRNDPLWGNGHILFKKLVTALISKTLIQKRKDNATRIIQFCVATIKKLQSFLSRPLNGQFTISLHFYFFGMVFSEN